MSGSAFGIVPVDPRAGLEPVVRPATGATCLSGDAHAYLADGTVYRPCPPWTESVHALLRHLEATGARREGPPTAPVHRWPSRPPQPVVRRGGRGHPTEASSTATTSRRGTTARCTGSRQAGPSVRRRLRPRRRATDAHRRSDGQAAIGGVRTTATKLSSHPNSWAASDGLGYGLADPRGAMDPRPRRCAPRGPGRRGPGFSPCPCRECRRRRREQSCRA